MSTFPPQPDSRRVSLLLKLTLACICTQAGKESKDRDERFDRRAGPAP
jgi:hypothetical protein